MNELRRRQVASDGFSSKRLTRVRALLEGHVDSGFVPGIVAVLARRGEVHVEAAGTLAFEGAGSSTPMAPDTICRLASMTKPIVAACAMVLVQDGTLSLDGPVDDLLPELGDMTVLVDPGGPLEETVAPPSRAPGASPSRGASRRGTCRSPTTHEGADPRPRAPGSSEGVLREEIRRPRVPL
jgi:CubicO group peptidase (beta-lactamase class C family)